MVNARQLQVSDLYRACPEEDLAFDNTENLTELPGLIGQQRAMDAVDFGINMAASGYNLYVMGASGAGKHTLAQGLLDQHARHLSKSDDWLYLHNFSDPQKPWALSLPAGQGGQLRHDIERTIRQLQTDLPHAFDDEYYRGRVRAIDETARKHRIRLFGTLQSEADKKGVVLLRLQDGSYAFAAKRDGEAVTSDEFEQLPLAEQEETEEAIASLHEDLQHTLLELHEWERGNFKKIQALNEEVASEIISNHLDKLRNAYPKSARLQVYFDMMQADIRENLDAFLKSDEHVEESSVATEHNLLRRYQVNLLVDNSHLEGAPVIYENLPNHQTLLGCVENMAMMGALITDFSLIKAGAVHRANGGFLILDAEQLLMQPYAWEGLKRALLSKEIRFDTLERMYSLVATVSLEPEPVPLDIKVVLLGDRRWYYELYEIDPEFARLFKVVADFEEDLHRDPAHHMLYARMIATTLKKQDLPAMQRDAVARVIEQASRDAEDNHALALHLGDLTDLLRESAFWAAKENAKLIARQHVEKALQQRQYRLERLHREILQQIQRNVIQIDVRGSVVGQVNALSVLTTGSFSFGQPARVTANCRYGDDTIIDIEREVELGGSIHAKGVLILSGYLGATYSQDKPLSMAASLVFEQNYGEIEGDSATVAELCALLSSIAKIPLKQSLAITGSMNQQGQVQAIGGVNEKIEGFFDVCGIDGLTGEQGVIIPVSNVQHLMLRADVRQAVAEGRFHLYAIEHVEQAIALLSGMPSGAMNEAGEYPEATFNQAVAKRLQVWADHHKSDKDGHHEQSETEGSD
ncbi:ATP-dependent protease La Type II [Methylophaga lonarensis MPL]|uniref:endopeptidase La n=1 Tax=Methylophaga lonarensis MPL TaxID=1286106 RepID=M7PER7_9GAMM|nr:ATP-binding protein [Methylophaga lonarensis]EMR12380.1 ATP-dependent protease La Type II [Methylophaga lonarensis MPL]